MRLTRFDENPIVRPDMLPGDDGKNINGPSLIRVPDWLPNPLGTYYLYFAHHGGKCIRLAYADDLHGPWTIHEPGTLRLEQTPCHGHVASPDVHVDSDRREIRMYYHGPVKDAQGNWLGQLSFVARSPDGLSFESGDEVLSSSYMRAFHWNGNWYAVVMPGDIVRSGDGLGGFEAGLRAFPYGGIKSRMRHPAVVLRGNRLGVFYSRVGDVPEHIVYSEIDLSGDWTTWQATPAVTVLEPELAYEGADLSVERSVDGSAKEPVRQLRDPAIFEDNGDTWLLYSVAGENGIAIATVNEGG